MIKTTKISKRAMGLVLAISLASSFGVAQLGSKFTGVSAAASSYKTGDELKVEKFPTSAKIVGNSFPTIDVPNAKIVGDDSAFATAELRNPYNQVVSLTAKAGVAGTFVANEVGDWTVTYSKTNITTGVKTEIKKMKISVLGEKASLKFSDNNSEIIPSEYNPKFKANGKLKPIILPSPEVLDEKGDKIESATCDIVIRKGTDAPISPTIVDGKNQFTIPEDTKAGIYTIRYSYKAGTREVATRTFTITIKPLLETDFKLKYNFKTTFPTSAVVGVETELPGVQGIVEETNANIETFYSINLFKRTTSGSVKVNDSMLVDGNKFTPTEEGDYYAVYSVEDFYGHKAKEIKWDIAPVVDSQKAQPIISKAYTIDEKGVSTDFEEQVWNLPSNGSITTALSLPALYAKDNAVKDAKKIKYSRYLINDTTRKKIVLDEFDPNKTGSIFSANKKLVLFAAEGATPADDEIFYTPKTSDDAVTAGNWTIYYEVKDIKNKENSTQYSLKIHEGAFNDTTPAEIVFSTALPSSIKPEGTITFAKPTAQDYAVSSGSTASKEIVDKRVNVQTFYEIGNAAKTMAEINDILSLTTMPTEVEDNKSMLELDVPVASESAGKKVFIYVVATDDSGNQSLLTKNIAITDILDASAPVFKTIDTTETSFDDNIKQKDEVVLPTITFTDNIVTHTNISVLVSHEDGTPFVVSKQEISRDITDKSITFSKGSFTATKYGNYTVTFVAVDAGNNISAKSFEFSAIQTVESRIYPSSLPKAFVDKKMELGEKVEMPVAKVVSSNGNEILNPEYTVKKISGPNADLDQEKFIPYEEGTYKFAYVYEETLDGGNVETLTETFTVVVKDTKAPEIKVNGSLPDVLEKNATIQIPRFTATDSFSAPTAADKNWVGYGVGIEEGSQEIEVLKNGIRHGEIIKYDAENTAFNRTFSENGIFTIRYKARDINGLEGKNDYTIKVGDITPPTIKIENEKQNKPEKIELDTKFVVDFKKITIQDSEDTEVTNENILKKLVVTVTNTTTGDLISNLLKDEEGNITGFEYKIEKVGTYRVEYTVRDNAYNTETVSHTFTVTEDANKGSIFNGDFWTPFLIVASLLVLGGVITYFGVSKSKYKKK